MPTVLAGLGRVADGGVRSVVSPLVELGAALHALGRPDHHGAEPWAEAVAACLGPELLAETRAWTWTTSAVRSRVFLRIPSVTTSVVIDDDAIRRLADLPPAVLADDLARPLVLPGSRSEETVAHLLEDPVGAADRFAAFLAATWDSWFAEEWQRVRPQLIAAARAFQDVAARRGTVAALSGLGPAFAARPSGDAVEIAKVQNRRHDVGTRGLVVTPSVSGSHHVYVGDVPGQPVVLQHPVQPAERAPAVDVIRRRLDALAHPARLEVARAIAIEARTAPEIALLWRMDATAVTRHLRALAAAGLATTERQGRYVRYRLDRDALHALGGDVLDLLLR